MEKQGVEAIFSSAAVAAGAIEIFRDVSLNDVDEAWQEVVEEGWVVDQGAVLLSALQASYHGDRSRFSDIVGFEAAVNGRGIPDLDIEVQGARALPILLRRGLAFAWFALSRSSGEVPNNVSAYVTLAPMLFEPEQVTGNVTFCSSGVNRRPYLDVEAHPGIAIRLGLERQVSSSSTGRDM